MQYILSKEELENLVPKQDKVDRDKALEIARKRILKAANRPCVYDNRSVRCDGCPCLETQEERKEYELKIGDSHDLYQLHRLICTLPKNFSK